MEISYSNTRTHTLKENSHYLKYKQITICRSFFKLSAKFAFGLICTGTHVLVAGAGVFVCVFVYKYKTYLCPGPSSAM